MRKLTPKYFVFFALLIAQYNSALFAQETARSSFNDVFLDNLVGEWNLKRKIRGQTAENTVTAKWVLSHQFLRIEMTDVKAPPQYEAVVYIGFDDEKKAYVVHWIDVFGGKFSETLGYGKREGNKIVFSFDYPSGPFRNTFTWDESQKTWNFLMQSRDKSGNWQLFAEDNLTRKK